MFGRTWGRGAVGSALEWHSRGQGFDSPRLHISRGSAPTTPPLHRAKPDSASFGSRLQRHGVRISGSELQLIVNVVEPPVAVKLVGDAFGYFIYFYN